MWSLPYTTASWYNEKGRQIMHSVTLNGLCPLPKPKITDRSLEGKVAGTHYHNASKLNWVIRFMWLQAISKCVYLCHIYYTTGTLVVHLFKNGLYATWV